MLTATTVSRNPAILLDESCQLFLVRSTRGLLLRVVLQLWPYNLSYFSYLKISENTWKYFRVVELLHTEGNTEFHDIWLPLVCRSANRLKTLFKCFQLLSSMKNTQNYLTIILILHAVINASCSKWRVCELAGVTNELSSPVTHWVYFNSNRIAL